MVRGVQIEFGRVLLRGELAPLSPESGEPEAGVDSVSLYSSPEVSSTGGEDKGSDEHFT